MPIRKPFTMLVLIALLLSVSSGALMAQTTTQAAVVAADISRLETTAASISQQVGVLKTSDPTLAGDVERSLADLADDITYLRVKMRREGSVTRDEYNGVRDRLETLRVKAQGQRVSAQPMLDAVGGVLPVGTQFEVRLQTPLDSGTAKIEQRFEATTVDDYLGGGGVLIPAGSVVRGFVSSVRAAGKLERRGELTLSFDEIRVGSRSYRLRASVVQAMESKVGEDATRIGTGAVVGAIIGGILGGGKGALLGVLVGGGGTMAATEGSDVKLPVGTLLRIRLDQPLEIAVSR